MCLFTKFELSQISGLSADAQKLLVQADARHKEA